MTATEDKNLHKKMICVKREKEKMRNVCSLPWSFIFFLHHYHCGACCFPSLLHTPPSPALYFTSSLFLCHDFWEEYFIFFSSFLSHVINSFAYSLILLPCSLTHWQTLLYWNCDWKHNGICLNDCDAACWSHICAMTHITVYFCVCVCSVV